MEKIQVNDIELVYTRRGQGSPLVLVHGFPIDGRIWNDVLPLLEDKFDLIIPDLRGFGGSSSSDAPVTMDTYASDIAGLLDHLGIVKAHLAGHSMGGYLSLAFARNYPERVSGLGLVATQALADAPERKQGRYDTAAQVAEKGIGVVVDAMTTKFTANAEIQVRARAIMEEQMPRGIMDALKALAERMDSTALLSTFKFPVAIVHGDADVLVPVERAREMKVAIPHAHLVELKGVGHLPMMESPQETAEALRHLA